MAVLLNLDAERHHAFYPSFRNQIVTVVNLLYRRSSSVFSQYPS